MRQEGLSTKLLLGLFKTQEQGDTATSEKIDARGKYPLTGISDFRIIKYSVIELKKQSVI